MTTLLTQADEAIKIYEEYKTNGGSVDLPAKFPHWQVIFSKITQVWKGKYEKQLIICDDDNTAQGIMIKFRRELDKIFSKKTDFMNLKKYYSYLIDHQVNSIGKQLFSSCITDEQKENMARNPRLLLTKINLEEFEIGKAHQKVEGGGTSYKVSQELEKIKSDKTGPVVAHMLRAHSRSNDPNDSSSEVTDVAFELASVRSSLEEVQKYTNVFATCGGYVINFIDAGSGKICKRFTDEHVNKRNIKEVYCKLAWTIINGKSVLVAGGKHGQVKVIMPNKNVCISRFDAHTGPINILMFHWKHSDILLSASDDLIKIWRIQIKDSLDSIECECNFELINQIEYRPQNHKKKEKVLSMCFIPNDYLLISTELENYVVTLTDDEMFNRNAASQIDAETNEKDMSTYLTTQVQETNNNKPKLTAEVLEIKIQQPDLEIKSEKILTNGFVYINGNILSPVVDENLIYKLDIGMDESESESSKIWLGVISSMVIYDHGKYKNDLDTNLTFVQGEDGILSMFQPSTDGCFYRITFNSDVTRNTNFYKHKLPASYTIKNKKDNYNIPVDNFNICELPTALKCASNDEVVVSTYNKNMIVIWKK